MPIRWISSSSSEISSFFFYYQFLLSEARKKLYIGKVTQTFKPICWKQNLLQFFLRKTNEPASVSAVPREINKLSIHFLMKLNDKRLECVSRNTSKLHLSQWICFNDRIGSRMVSSFEKATSSTRHSIDLYRLIHLRNVCVVYTEGIGC